MADNKGNESNNKIAALKEESASSLEKNHEKKKNGVVSNGRAATSDDHPKIISDPRFQAAKKLVQTGRVEEGAIDMLSLLLEECIQSRGPSDVETATVYYEYGNALLRSAQATAQQDKQDGDKITARQAAAQAAQQRLEEKSKGGSNAAEEEEDSKLTANNDKDDNKEKEDDATSDFTLALEMMENCWSIYDETLETQPHHSLYEWMRRQRARVLQGLGDVLTALERFGDAVDAYTRAIPHRQSALDDLKDDESKVEALEARRQLAEANILVAEALLACPRDEDVITTETKDVLVRAAERVDYARGYYDKARDALQETVFFMGRLAAKGADIKTEKENVCFCATLVMGVGEALAEWDEQQQNETEPPTKKAKTI